MSSGEAVRLGLEGGGVALFAGMMLAAVLLAGGRSSRLLAWLSLGLVAIAAIGVAVALLVGRTIPVSGFDCTFYPHNGYVAIGLLFSLAAIIPLYVAARGYKPAAQARSAVLIGGGEIALAFVSLVYITMANPQC